MLEGKTIVVTGAGKGIGRACVEHFLSCGGSVVALTRGVDDVASLKREHSEAACEILLGDVTCRADLEQARDRAIRRFGSVHGLLNNAGIRQRKDFLALSRADFDEVLSCNLTSCFEAMQVFIPALLESGGGSIVNMASIVGPGGFAQLAGYAAAKAGLIGLSRSVAVEFAGAGLRVNVIAPGFVETSYAESFRKNRAELHRWTVGRTPMGRWGTAAEIAACAAFLLSDLSGYVTGAVHAVDGGWMAG